MCIRVKRAIFADGKSRITIQRLGRYLLEFSASGAFDLSTTVATCFRDYVQGVQLLSTACGPTLILLRSLKTQCIDNGCRGILRASSVRLHTWATGSPLISTARTITRLYAEIISLSKITAVLLL